MIEKQKLGVLVLFFFKNFSDRGRGLQREKAGEAEEREDWVGEGRQNFPGSLSVVCLPSVTHQFSSLAHVQTWPEMTACQLAQ